jgi:hypothetical protein
MTTGIVTLLVLLAQAVPLVRSEKVRPKTPPPRMTNESTERADARAMAWWVQWVHDHPEVGDLAWENLGEEDRAEVGRRVEETLCRTNPKCLRVSDGASRPLPGEGAWEEADKERLEKAAEDKRCSANQKCAGERVAKDLCEYIASLASTKTEIKCRHQLAHSEVTLGSPSRIRRARMNSVCPDDRSRFSDYETFGELNGLVEELNRTILEQKAQYKQASHKTFSDRVCRDL